MSTLGDALANWASAEPAVQGLVLIGSRARAADDAVWRPDPQSDWDFQVITSDPEKFSTADWTRALPGWTVRAYAPRTTTRVGRVPKVAILFDGAEADLVILPAAPLRLMKLMVALGRHRRDGWTRRALQDLAIVIRPGWQFLKGADRWEPFYRRVVAEVPDVRLDDTAVRNLAAGFRCDAVWTLRKIDRGEFLTAQRMLHHALAETNFRLLHELNLRRGARTFPDARRIERVAAPDDLTAVAVAAEPSRESLREAVRKAGETCDRLLGELVGGESR